jgi:hypothetical protein
MSDQIGPSELLHERNIMATALATAAECIDMLLRVKNGQVNEPMLIRQLQRFHCPLQADATGRTLGNHFIRHIIRVKTDFQRIVASLMFCPAQALCQCERSRITNNL